MSFPNSEIRNFNYGTFSYDYELVYQKRKSLSLTVSPDKTIVLKVPNEASEERIESFLTRKWQWLEKQLGFFDRAASGKSNKEYISGESFYYLGRQYMLIVKKGDLEKVTLSKGKLNVTTNKEPADLLNNKRLLDTWFYQRAEKIFRERFEEVRDNFDYKKFPKLRIRKMSKRWGSFLREDVIILNPKLIHSSKACIDYVISHELCHMRYKNHDKKFYQLLSIKYPGWQRVKEKLELEYRN